MKKWKERLISSADKFDFPIHKPYFQLTEEQKRILWKGNKYFYGIDRFFEHLEEKKYKIQYRVLLSRYRGKTTCHECKGSRLRKEAGYVKVAESTLQELVAMPVGRLYEYFMDLSLSPADAKIAERLLKEITIRLRFLIDVGLPYLTLDRLSSTLSGGESQRINLSTSLGSNLVGSMYILDEPSIGLHPRDTNLLIKVLKELRDLGNTVIVVEHEEEIIRAADEIVDMGPEAGRLGGEVVYQGGLDLTTSNKSLTAGYLSGRLIVPVPLSRRKWNSFIEVKGARENNLKNIDVQVSASYNYCGYRSKRFRKIKPCFGYSLTSICPTGSMATTLSRDSSGILPVIFLDSPVLKWLIRILSANRAGRILLHI